MKKPLVAVVGRPNVGKSTFFNKICGKRISIVKDIPGVTRDRIYADAEWCGHNFTLVDTGGLDFSSEDEFNKNIINQAQIAIDLADVIVFLCDGMEGISAKDHDVADMLRKSHKPVVLVINKLDRFEVDKTYEFYELAIGQPFPISCEQSKGLGEVLDEIVSNFDEKAPEDEEEKTLKIAIVGKPNAGKSSITNRLLGQDRVIVSSVAGTTRDAIDTPFRFNNENYIAIDTAGMRRNKNVAPESVEAYSIIRSMEAIRRADIVAIVFDSSEPLSEQDVRIAGFVHEEGKPCVVVMNKWDLPEKEMLTMKKMQESVLDKLAFMDYAEVVFLSAKTGKRMNLLMPALLKAYANASKRITTGTLNEMLHEATLANEPPSKNGRRLKISYATQVSTNPPTFVLFCNEPDLMHFSYLRYLENTFRKMSDFQGTPIKFILKGKSEKV